MFTFAMLIASLGFAISLPILNVDAFIVDQNIHREVRDSANLDTQYFLNLSDDAIPALVSAYQTPTLPDSVREKVGASLACIHYQRGLDTRELSWQAFRFATLNADKALASVEIDLKKYPVISTDYPVTVAMPSGEEFSCGIDYSD
jgi:hypothetical protein